MGKNTMLYLPANSRLLGVTVWYFLTNGEVAVSLDGSGSQEVVNRART
jgi:hypothetical protein